jgi:LacI family transcriptional regulator
VGESTRARIEQVSRELRYVPNRAARSLNTSRTHTIGVVLPDLYGAFFSELLCGLDQAARSHHHQLLVAGSHGGSEDLAAALQAMNGRVDALVVMSPVAAADVLEANLPAHLPAILVGAEVPGFGALAVDHRGGAEAMTRHLVALGHRRIAHVTGGATNRDAADRLAGYRTVMREAGLSMDGLVVEGDFTERSGDAAVRGFLDAGTGLDALFAANDAMALGALGALREAGLRVPDDVALAGFDDILLGRYLAPPLTSVHVPLDQLSRLAVERLVAATEAGTQLESTPAVLSTTLVVRASCGAGGSAP